MSHADTFPIGAMYNDGTGIGARNVRFYTLSGGSSPQLQTAGNRAGITFVAYPSPVTETLNLELNGAAQGTITLSDLSGKVLGTYPANTRSIDMRNITNGMYFVTFSDGVNRIAQRVIRN